MKLPCSKLPLIIKESALAWPATRRKLNPIPSAIAFTIRINNLRTNEIREDVLDPEVGSIRYARPRQYIACHTSLVIDAALWTNGVYATINASHSHSIGSQINGKKETLIAATSRSANRWRGRRGAAPLRRLERVSRGNSEGGLA